MDKKEYHRKYNRERYHKLKKEFQELLGGACVVCGTTESLEFDHIEEATKTMEVGHMLKVSKERALAEVAKCQLLCTEHHKQKTTVYKSVEHGGGVSGKRNCKCDPCRERKNEYMREYKRKRRNASIA